ncbi:MAG: diaminopimelate epimerase [Candidatus Melainabacteria bacterium]|nr:MAG: diaminopimelate epimerase [Candidatus Melainabacteria bacterium]
MAGCRLAWTFTNNDGSKSKTCGNAMRCLALWAYKKGLLKDRAKVLTETGPVEVVFHSEEKIEVDLGVPHLAAQEVPFTGVDSGKQVVASPFNIGSDNLQITSVSMGNPHCLVFSAAILANTRVQLPFDRESQLQELPPGLAALAEKIQADPRFPEGVNVSFVLSHKRDSARAIVFERGCGATLACGSAAAAILVGGVLEGRLDRQATITLPGGNLLVNWSNQDNRVRITGPARLVFEGHFALPLSQLNLPKRSALSGAMAK